MSLCTTIIAQYLISSITATPSPSREPTLSPLTYCEAGYGDYDGIDYEDEDWESYLPSGSNERISNSFSSSNVYDTYNADECMRVRRPWNALNTEERHLYIDGLLELRARGQLDMDLDELVAVASVHDDWFGSVTHKDSDYLFWHGYLVWELESRIRNLGGKYKCFGMPYWDWSNEYGRPYDETPYIYQTGLGGYGNPDDYWAVNGFSWDVTTKQYWAPIQKDVACLAEGDYCPICAMKREGFDFEGVNEKSPLEFGDGILKNPGFIQFQEWITTQCGLPHSVDNSYDPIWYLFHSMESYFQAMWVNCHNYDEINVEDLGEYPMAFSSYCEETTAECEGIELQSPLHFGGVLAKRPWSFIHNEILTIQKLYSLPKWNVIYDLNDDDFFINSGLKTQCEDKLNPEWFISPRDNQENRNDNEFNLVFNLAQLSVDKFGVYSLVSFILFCAVIIWIFMRRVVNNKSKEHKSSKTDYGSISSNSVTP